MPNDLAPREDCFPSAFALAEVMDVVPPMGFVLSFADVLLLHEQHSRPIGLNFDPSDTLAEKQKRSPPSFSETRDRDISMVRATGLEPARNYPIDPKSIAAAITPCPQEGVTIQFPRFYGFYAEAGNVDKYSHKEYPSQ